MSVSIQSGFNQSPSVAFTQFANGMEDVVVGFVCFPSHAIKYILGVDEHFGQDASWRGVFRHYYGFGDAVSRVPSIVNHAILGGVNVVTGGLPHVVVNQWIGIDNNYFAPPARNWRELAHYLTGTFFISAGMRYGGELNVARRVSLQREALVTEARSVFAPATVNGPRVIVPIIRYTPNELAHRAVTGLMSREEVAAILSNPSPNLIPFVRTWLILQPETLVLNMRSLVKSIVDIGRLSDDAIYVLSSLARRGNTQVSWAFAVLLERLPQYRSALIVTMLRDPDFWPHIPWEDMVKLANNNRGTAIYGDIIILMEEVGKPAEIFLHRLEPARAQCTAPVANSAAVASETILDIKGGREAMLAQRILAGEYHPSITDIKRLGFFARQGVSGAVDALFKTAWAAGEHAQAALNMLRELQVDSRHHHETIMVMVERLAEKGTDPAGIQPVNVAVWGVVETLKRQIVLKPDAAVHQARQLFARVASGDTQAMAVVIDLFESTDPKVADVLARSLVTMAEDGSVSIGLVRDVVSSGRASAGLRALIIEIRHKIEVNHSPLFEPLGDLLHATELRINSQ